jgi:hypothetical protein
VGEETATDIPATKEMARNAQGNVVGHLFQFRRHTLNDFATWFQDFDGTVNGKSGTCRIEIRMPIFENRTEAITALRELSSVREITAR